MTRFRCRAGVIIIPMAAIALPLAGRALAQNPPPSSSQIPNNPSDVYIQGKFDKSGTYVPPHYAPKPKPAFHGYFDNNTEYKHGYFYSTKPKSGDHKAPPG